MTTKREKKDEPKAAKRPKLKKETLKDLDADKQGAAVRGGRPVATYVCSC